MADEDDDQEQDETPEPPQRLFTLTEAERVRQELEPFLVEAMDCRKKLAIKDLDVGLLDFPAVIDNQDVYLCWKVGEDRIRFYHRQDEGFAGRKPLDPRDPGPGDKVQ